MSLLLANPPELVLARLLQAQTFANAPNRNKSWPVYVTVEPEQPDDVITIVNTEGVQTGRLQSTGEVQDHYGVQIRVRSTAYQTGRSKLNTIVQYLDQTVKRTSVTIGSTSYLIHCASRTSGLLYLGQMRDNSSRELFTTNYLVTITEES